MIIKVKTNGEIVKARKKKHISGSKKSTCYRIKPAELPEAIKAIHKEKGVWKFKILIEDSKELSDDEEE